MGRQNLRRRHSGQDRRVSDERTRPTASLQPGRAGASGNLPNPSYNTNAERRIGWGGMPLDSDRRGPARQADTGDWAERRIRMDSGGAGGREELQRLGSGQGSKRRAQSVERHPSPTGHVAQDNIRIVTRASPEEEGELGSRRIVAAVGEAGLGLDRACSKRARVGTPSDQRVTLSVPLPKVNPESTARLHRVSALLGPLSFHRKMITIIKRTRMYMSVVTPDITLHELVYKLHNLYCLQEIVKFVSNVAPTWEESNLRDAALGRVQGACAMMHLYEVFPFGSKASGLELWNSDIDVVILGVMEPSRDNLGALQFHACLTFNPAVTCPSDGGPKRWHWRG